MVEPNKSNTQAENSSVAVGNINVGGSVSGDIRTGNTI